MSVDGDTAHTAGNSPNGNIVQMTRNEVVKHDEAVRVIEQLLLSRWNGKIAA